MQELTTFLDSKQKEAENLTRLVNIAAQCKGLLRINLAEAHRKLIREDTFGTKTVYLFNDILLVIERTHDKSVFKRFSRDTYGSKALFHWNRNLNVVKTSSGFRVLSAGTLDVIIDVTVPKADAVAWRKDFRQQVRKQRKAATAENKLRNVKCESPRSVRPLIRDDSYIVLQQNLDVVQNHMFKLDVHMRGTKKKKEKEQLKKLRESLIGQASLLDAQIETKKQQRMITEATTITAVKRKKSKLSRSSSVDDLLSKKISNSGGS